MRTPLRLLRLAATLVLLAACTLVLLRAALDVRCFRDENESVQVAVNLLARGQYGLVLSKPNFDAFYPEMSIGIVSNWPAALGWGLGGNLLAARLAVSAYCLLLWAALGSGFVRSFVPSWRPLALPLALGGFLVAIMLVPQVPTVIVQALGEFSGAVVLGLAYLLLRTHPRAAAVTFGLCVWHAKFIYAPFALLGMGWAAWRRERAAAGRARASALELALFLTPLLVWIALVRIQTGPAGLAEWGQRRLFMYRIGHYSNPPSLSALSGLRERLASPKLEWVHYSTAAKLEVLGLLFLPCVILLSEIGTRRRTQRRDLGLDLLQSGLVLGFLASAYWYFLLHQYMWLRHLLPALLIGFGVLAWFTLTRAASLPRRHQAWLAVLVALALALEHVPEWPETVRRAAAAAAPHTFALKCRADDPWRAGPWPREACWEPTLHDWP